MPFLTPGKYLVCNEGTPKYSKVKVIAEFTVLGVEGLGKGVVMTISEWDILVENNLGAMCIESDKNCNDCSSYSDGKCERTIYPIDIEDISKPRKKLPFLFRIITCCALDD